MKSLRVKLAAGVAVLGVAGVGTAAVAHDRSRFDAALTGYEEVPDALDGGQRRRSRPRSTAARTRSATR